MYNKKDSEKYIYIYFNQNTKKYVIHEIYAIFKSLYEYINEWQSLLNYIIQSNLLET